MKRRNGARIGLTAALALAAAGAAAAPAKIDIVAFGLWGDQRVFASEAEGAARVIAHQFGPVDKVIVRANTKRGGEATEDNLRTPSPRSGRRWIRSATFFSSSSPRMAIRRASASRRRADVADHADRAARLPRESGARLSVVIVSACYSGVFAERWPSPTRWSSPPPTTTMLRSAVATAPSGRASARRSSRRAGQTKSLPAAFALARGLVAEREQAEGFRPVQPADGRRARGAAAARRSARPAIAQNCQDFHKHPAMFGDHH